MYKDIKLNKKVVLKSAVVLSLATILGGSGTQLVESLNSATAYAQVIPTATADDLGSYLMQANDGVWIRPLFYGKADSKGSLDQTVDAKGNWSLGVLSNGLDFTKASKVADFTASFNLFNTLNSNAQILDYGGAMVNDSGAQSVWDYWFKTTATDEFGANTVFYDQTEEVAKGSTDVGSLNIKVSTDGTVTVSFKVNPNLTADQKSGLTQDGIDPSTGGVKPKEAFPALTFNTTDAYVKRNLAKIKAENDALLNNIPEALKDSEQYKSFLDADDRSIADALGSKDANGILNVDTYTKDWVDDLWKSVVQNKQNAEDIQGIYDDINNVKNSEYPKVKADDFNKYLQEALGDFSRVEYYQGGDATNVVDDYQQVYDDFLAKLKGSDTGSTTDPTDPTDPSEPTTPDPDVVKNYTVDFILEDGTVVKSTVIKGKKDAKITVKVPKGYKLALKGSNILTLDGNNKAHLQVVVEAVDDGITRNYTVDFYDTVKGSKLGSTSIKGRIGQRVKVKVPDGYYVWTDASMPYYYTRQKYAYITIKNALNDVHYRVDVITQKNINTQISLLKQYAFKGAIIDKTDADGQAFINKYSKQYPIYIGTGHNPDQLPEGVTAESTDLSGITRPESSVKLTKYSQVNFAIANFYRTDGTGTNFGWNEANAGTHILADSTATKNTWGSKDAPVDASDIGFKFNNTSYNADFFWQTIGTGDGLRAFVKLPSSFKNTEAFKQDIGKVHTVNAIVSGATGAPATGLKQKTDLGLFTVMKFRVNANNTMDIWAIDYGLAGKGLRRMPERLAVSVTKPAKKEVKQAQPKVKDVIASKAKTGADLANGIVTGVGLLMATIGFWFKKRF